MRTWRRATGRRNASDAIEQTMKTTNAPIVPAPSRSATAAAPAASATGPRKNSPGVRISPTASATANTTHRTQPTTRTIEPQRSPSATGISRRSSRASASGPKRPGAIDEERAHADGAGALDVVLDRVADHHRLVGADAEQLEHAAEDRLVRFRLAVRARGEHRVDGEARGARRTRPGRGRCSRADRSSGRRSRSSRASAARRRRARSGARGSSAPSISTAAAWVSPTPPMPSMIRCVKSTQISSSWSSSGWRSSVCERGAPRVLVAGRVERQAVAPAEPLVALRAEVGTGPRDREVDVEDHRFQHGRDDSLNG